MPTPREIVQIAVDKAIQIQQPAIDRYVEQLRHWRPESPQDAIRLAERQFLATVGSLGAAAGGAAAAPGVGTAVGVAVSAVEIGAYTEAAALFVLSCAQIHGIRVQDLEKRRLLLYSILIGDSGGKAAEKVAGRSGPHWAKGLIKAIDPNKLRAVNRVLGRNFVTKYGTRQGILVLGRALPFGIGAGIGGAGNLGLSYLTVRTARRAFGPAPAAWPLSDATRS